MRVVGRPKLVPETIFTLRRLAWEMTRATNRLYCQMLLYRGLNAKLKKLPVNRYLFVDGYDGFMGSPGYRTRSITLLGCVSTSDCIWEARAVAFLCKRFRRLRSIFLSGAGSAQTLASEMFVPACSRIVKSPPIDKPYPYITPPVTRSMPNW